MDVIIALFLGSVSVSSSGRGSEALNDGRQ